MSDAGEPAAPWGAPLEQFGLIGDTRTAALVSPHGAIEWMCAPRFDCPPIFGRLVGGPDAGTFEVRPASGGDTPERRYIAGSATLETIWRTPTGRVRATDAMIGEVAGRLLPQNLLVRRIEALDGATAIRTLFDPRYGEQRRRPRWSRRGDDLVCSWGPLALGLRSDPPLPLTPGAAHDAVLEPGRPLTFALSIAESEPLVHVDPSAAWAEVERDTARWQKWSGEIPADVEPHEVVVRSLITLRLLSYSPSGAPVAAPTTSLPEHIGGSRNWDYRYCWPRDASIGINTFLALGHPEQATAFLAWLVHATRLDRPQLRALLTLHGRRPGGERTAENWPGYHASTPVRFGNGAADQHQLDGYGWVIDAAWQYTRRHQRLNGETWRAIKAFADRVADHWDEPDAGIWEERADPSHHVHSKLMAWLALDRAARIAEHDGRAARSRRRWLVARDLVGDDLHTRGFDEQRGAYTRSYGSHDLDAAVLVLPLIGLEPADSSRTRSTIDAMRDELDAGGGLLYRYAPGSDGIDEPEGAFLPCAFWLVQALAFSGRTDEAHTRFSRLLERMGPLGLLPEEIEPTTGRFTGNYPQALTHAALLQAALALHDHDRDHERSEVAVARLNARRPPPSTG